MNFQKIIDSLCVCLKKNPEFRVLKVDVENNQNIATNSKNESHDKERLHNILKEKNNIPLIDNYSRIFTYSNNIQFLKNNDKKNKEKPFFYRNFTLKNGIIHDESDENNKITNNNNNIKSKRENNIKIIENNKEKENKKTSNTIEPQEQLLHKSTLNKKKNIKTVFTYHKRENFAEQLDIINSDKNQKEGIVQEVINEKSAFKEFQNNMDDIIKKSLLKKQYSESDD